MDTVISVIVRPLTALVIFGTAFSLGRAVLRAIPEGRVKRLLSRRYEVVPTGPVSRRTQWVATTLMVAIVAWLAYVEFVLKR